MADQPRGDGRRRQSPSSSRRSSSDGRGTRGRAGTDPAGAGRAARSDRERSDARRADDRRRGDRRESPPTSSGGRRDQTRRTGGFGPYPVDRRDEETRERRQRPDDDRRTSARSGRPALRTVGERRSSGGATPSARRSPAASAPARRRRRRGPADVQQELARVAGRNANRALGTLMAAADAFAHDREREALRILRPLRDQLPESPSVRELVGLCQYRIGNYAAAAKELEAYADLSGSVEQNPVLMDCYRALKRWRKVEELWLELAQVSPSGTLVTEGRIVYAGAVADQGRLSDALALLRKRAAAVKSPSEHHLRLWYALADLEERAGNLARARELFHQVRRADPAFADVAERLAALG